MLNNETLSDMRTLALGGLTLPESWTSVDDLAYWFAAQGNPLLVNAHTEVTDAEGFTVITLLKHKNFQIELYLMRNQMMLPNHVHPGVTVLTLELGGASRHPEGDANCGGAYMCNPVYSHPDTAHGGTDFPITGKGWVALSYQEWPVGIEPKPVTVWWVGPTIGPRHEALIESHFPGGVTYSGFADITRTETYQALLEAQKNGTS